MRGMAETRTDNELIALAQAGDIAARDALIHRHMKFIYAFTKKHCGRHRPQEFIGEAVLGFIRAIEKFDTGKKIKLLTYAGWWIWQKVRLAMHQDEMVIRVSNLTTGHLDRMKPWDAQAAMNAAKCRPSPVSEYIAERPVHRAGDDIEFVRSVLLKMKPRTRRVIEMRMAGATLEEAGREIGVTRERARQIQNEGHYMIERAYNREVAA